MSGLAAVYGEEADPDLVVEMLDTIAYRDVKNARLVAEYLETDHYELVLGLDEILAVLPKVIYYLESFDPSLVRSSVANYLISRAARKEGYEILLSGEGGDEAFCGYLYL